MSRVKRIAVACNLAVTQLNDTCRIALRQFRIVGDHDDEMILRHFLQKPYHLLARLTVQRASRLIGKNHRRMELAEWLEEAETEKGNADAVFGFVAHKRRGFGDAKIGGTYVAMTLDDWIEMVR